MVICFTDGSSSWKTQEGGSGVYIQNIQKGFQDEIKLSFPFYNIKTGQAELAALIFCLTKLLELGVEDDIITIFSDSQYVVKELNEWSYDHVKQNFAGKKNVELLYYLLYLKFSFSNLNILWCKGHQIGKTKVAEGNNIADELATSHRNLPKEQLLNFREFLSDIQREIEDDDIINFVTKNYVR